MDFETEDNENFFAHSGVIRKSGRYPWGSGSNPHQRNKEFLDHINELRKEGMSDTDIAKYLEIKTPEFRARQTIAKDQVRAANVSQAMRLKDTGMSTTAIGKEMGINESSVRTLLDPALAEKHMILTNTANTLRDHVTEKRYLDVGAGTEIHLGISRDKLNTAVSMLENEGYNVDQVKIPQLGTGKETRMKVLSEKDVTYKELLDNQHKIGTPAAYSEDGGRSFREVLPPNPVKSKRVAVRFAEDGGADMDGVIELRRNVPDLSLGSARYAQVRISVDGTHYLKGMAMYADDLPDGVDMRFNTNKSKTEGKMGAMKPIKSDAEPDNPFGSTIRQKTYFDGKGKELLSPLNIVGSQNDQGDSTSGEEGGWYKWSRNLSSQMLSKQKPELAKQQLDVLYQQKKLEYDEINTLTNPTVKQKLLISFADGADSAAVSLHAAGLPRTRAHVILPINSLKDNEIYAPGYNNGEKVVLIRHPHGGIFEIPELTVNNKNAQANRLIKNAKDAVGINARVAERLSGADFDGDTVLVIPNAASGKNRVQNSPTLAALKNFDPKAMYPKYDGMKLVGEPGGGNKQKLMGDISNLITDMTIQKAPHSEIARAVKHSMVVIDAEKHKLNYKQSAIDNNIKELKIKYQGKANGGASTLVSRAGGDERIPERKDRTVALGGPIDKATGRKMYEATGKSYPVKSKSGVESIRYTQQVVKKLANRDDAFDLVSANGGTPIEAVYADHSNKLKALANTARKEYLATPNLAYDKSARVAYEPQVKSLNAKLTLAQRNAPVERLAQRIAKSQFNARVDSKPGMDSAEMRKIKGQVLTKARITTGAKKQRIDISTEEWNAIQAGAISHNKLASILANADLDQVKALATPRAATVMVSAKVARAKTMLASGYSQSEVAQALGVPVSTLNSSLEG